MAIYALNFYLPPFVLSKLFTRRLKGGIEKQSSGVVGWLLPPQLWGKVGMGVSPKASPPSQPCMSQNRVVVAGEEASDRPSLVLRLLRQVRGEAKIGVSSFLVTVLCKPERLDGCTPH